MTERLSIKANNRRALWITFGLTFTYFIVEVVVGLWTNSLTLLADTDPQDITGRPCDS